MMMILSSLPTTSLKGLRLWPCKNLAVSGTCFGISKSPTTCRMRSRTETVGMTDLLALGLSIRRASGSSWLVGVEEFTPILLFRHDGDLFQLS